MDAIIENVVLAITRQFCFTDHRLIITPVGPLILVAYCIAESVALQQL